MVKGKNVVVNFVGKDGMSAVIRRVNTGLAATKTKSGLAGAGINGLALRFIGLNAVVTMGIQKFKELAQWIGEDIEKFREFENRMAEVSTILQADTMKNLMGLQTGVEQLSIAFGKSANDLSNGLYDILSAAIDSSEAIQLLNTATKASIAGLTTVSTSVDVFTSILNSYGKTVAQAAGVSDVLFQTVVRGKLRFEDLASAMGYITPIAANAGVAFEEIAAVLATVTRQGLHVDMASRGLALMLQGIVNPATAAAQAASKFGVDMSGLALRVKGLTGFMEDINVATTEFGIGVLPQMIRNMRSLRVAMALAGEEGVRGFADDMDYMATATGRTDEALAKMMNTQKRQAEILASSMELVERKIGEAWSGVDIWWKKTQLWWGTLLSGGDAGAAVAGFDDQVTKMKAGYLELMNAQSKLAGQKPLSTLLLESDDISGTMMALGELKSVKEYLDVGDQIESLSAYSLGVQNLKDTMDLLGGDARIFGPGFNANKDLDLGYALDGLEEINKAITTYNSKVEEANQIPLFTSESIYGDFENTLKRLNKLYEEQVVDVRELGDTRNTLQPYFDYFKSGFDDLSDTIINHKTNIVELQNALAELKVDVQDVYTALSGEQFAGKMGFQLAIKIDETKLDRFEQFSSMATKYGTSMEQYVSLYGELDTELSAAISTIYKYNKAVEEQKQAELELKDALDENLKAIRQNNLERMKLQLIGMMRRRGNTRMEQKIMKKLDIDNLRLRIDSMGQEIKAEEETAETEVDLKEAAYNKAKQLLSEYIDTEKHNLWLLKDIRDDEILDLQETIGQKEKLLTKYTDWYGDELEALGVANNTYVTALQTLANEMPSLYEELFGVGYIEKYLADMAEFLDVAGIADITTSPGITPKNTPEYDKYIYKNAAANDVLKWTTGEKAPANYDISKYRNATEAKQAGAYSTTNSVTVQVNNPQLNTETDVERLAALLGSAITAQLANPTGKTKYRMR